MAVVRFLSLLTRISAVFGKATVHGYTMSLEVFTEQLVSTAAVEAFTAQLRVVSNDPLADLEALDVRANRRDDTNCFVTRHQGELRHC
jgi:hypothetical protein